MNIDREELISRKFFHGWWLRIDRRVFRKGWIARVSDNPLPRQDNKVWEFFSFFFPFHFVLKSRAHIILQVYYSKHFLKYLSGVSGGSGGISFTLSPSSISVNEKESGEGKRHYSGPKYRDYTIVEKSEIYPGLAIRPWKSLERGREGKIGNFTKTCVNANSSLTYGEPRVINRELNSLVNVFTLPRIENGIDKR